MSIHKPALAGAAGMVLLLSAWTACLAEEAASPEPAAAEREVPELQVPGVEALPPGESPEPWTTWVTDQEVDSIPRISIELRLGIVQSLPRMAGSGPNAPKYTDINDPGQELALGTGYRLTPSIGIDLQYLLFRMPGIPYNFDPAGSSSEFDDAAAMGLVVGLKLALPLAYPSSKLFRFQRTEAPEGFSVYARIGFGVALNFKRNILSQGSMAAPYDVGYYHSGIGFLFAGALGMEFRWVHFGLCLEFGYWDLGKPTPSNDPLWAERSKSQSFAVVGGMLGFNLSF